MCLTVPQRSPTYVLCREDRDPVANLLGRLLPAKLAYAIVRWKNVTLQQVRMWARSRARVRSCCVRDAASDILPHVPRAAAADEAAHGFPRCGVSRPKLRATFHAQLQPVGPARMSAAQW